jgi:phosphoglycerate dehydrogenase-like enzyme
MQLTKIALIDCFHLTEKTKAALETMAELHSYDEPPEGELDAEALLVSFRTRVDAAFLARCPELRYIGLCGTNSDKIDLASCTERGIVVTNVTDYGDIGVVEWILKELLLLTGPGGPWGDERVELHGKTIGILGLGTVGTLLAERCLALGMRVLHHSKNGKPEMEAKGVERVDKKTLLTECDIVSIQTPRDLRILEKEDFSLMKNTILFNNTLGVAFEAEVAEAWLAEAGNLLIMDCAPETTLRKSLSGKEAVCIAPYISGITQEAAERLGERVVANLEAFRKGAPTNLINR